VKSFVLVIVFLGVTTLFISATISLVGLSIALVGKPLPVQFASLGESICLLYGLPTLLTHTQTHAQ
jgi:hypothetical protein